MKFLKGIAAIFLVLNVCSAFASSSLDERDIELQKAVENLADSKIFVSLVPVALYGAGSTAALIGISLEIAGDFYGLDTLAVMGGRLILLGGPTAIVGGVLVVGQIFEGTSHAATLEEYYRSEKGIESFLKLPAQSMYFHASQDKVLRELTISASKIVTGVSK